MLFLFSFSFYILCFYTRSSFGGRCGRDRMVVTFTTTYAISAYHHWGEFESRSGPCVQHYVITFISDLRQVGGFPRVLRFPLLTKLTSRYN